MLKAYELVPEAYSQRFRLWENSGKQTHMVFTRELNIDFNREEVLTPVNLSQSFDSQKWLHALSCSLIGTKCAIIVKAEGIGKPNVLFNQMLKVDLVGDM